MKANCKYNDIINLPRHVSDRYAKMPIGDRAAQFSPFAALTGYEDVICETARLTDYRAELDETEKILLNEKLRRIKDASEANSQITVTWFREDDRKSGGAYMSFTGRVKKLDLYQQSIHFTDGMVIPFSAICHIETDV